MALPDPPPDAAGGQAPQSGRAVDPLARRRLAVLVTAFTGLVIASNVGTVLSATLVTKHPVALLALSSRMRHLVLTVAADIDPLPYAVVGGLRLAAAAFVTFLLGHSFGAAALDWIERQAQGQLPATFRWLERGVDRFGAGLVVLMPGSNIVCALVGVRGMTLRRFSVLITLGIALRLVSMWVLARVFEGPLDAVLDFIERYQWWLVAGFFALTVASSFRRASKVQPPLEHPGVEPTEAAGERTEAD